MFDLFGQPVKHCLIHARALGWAEPNPNLGKILDPESFSSTMFYQTCFTLLYSFGHHVRGEQKYKFIRHFILNITKSMILQEILVENIRLIPHTNYTTCVHANNSCKFNKLVSRRRPIIDVF